MSTNPTRPQALTCCAFHEMGGAMGQRCSEEPDDTDLFSSLTTYQMNPPRVVAPKPEADPSVDAAARTNRATLHRAYHSTCQKCGSLKSRGSTPGIKTGPMLCPTCEPIAYARAHGPKPPSPEEYLAQYADKSVAIEVPTAAELRVLCFLHVHGGLATLADLPPRSKRALGVLFAQHRCGRVKGYPNTIRITEAGREAMRAALTLCLPLPAPIPETSVRPRGAAPLEPEAQAVIDMLHLHNLKGS